jgi:hypothetical protein
MGTMASSGIILKHTGLWEGIKMWMQMQVVRYVKLTFALKKAVIWDVMPCSR